jgi:hypothetical protein
MSNIKLANAVVGNRIDKHLTLDGSASQNIFQVTGIVGVEFLYGFVDVAIAADTTGAYLNLYDGTDTVAITLVAGAPALSSLPIGSYLVKEDLATSILGVHSAATGTISEVIRATTNCAFVAVQKTAGVATYIRLTRAGAGATGKIHWHCGWMKMSDDANVVAV